MDMYENYQSLDQRQKQTVKRCSCVVTVLVGFLTLFSVPLIFFAFWYLFLVNIFIFVVGIVGIAS